MPRPVLTRLAALTSASVLTLALAGCGSDAADKPGQQAVQSDGAFPVTIENCGTKITFDKAPEKGVLLKSAAVPYLHEIGVLDKVVTARAGAYSRDYYDDKTWAELKGIPMLSDEIDSGGHLQISKEVVLAQQPQIVFGSADNLTRETLGAAGIPLIEEPALCPKPPANPTFESVSEQLRTYGKIFGVNEAADAAVERAEVELKEILAKVSKDEKRTAAVLYPTVGGGTTYAYGTKSMADPQLRAAGFTNVFGDVKERVFEVTLEELIGRNPDVLIVLHSDGDPAEAKKAVTQMNGAAALNAVKNDQILVQLFNFTEPPSPLAIDGLRNIVEHFAR